MFEFFVSRFESWKTTMVGPEMLWGIGFMALILIFDFWKRGWRMSWSRRAVASVLATLAIFHINLVFVPIVWLASQYFNHAYAALGIPTVPTVFWSGFPAWLLVPFAIVVYDLADYWTHRFLHMKWLWPVHAIHHSDPEVTGLTNYRIHFLEALVMWSCYTVLLTWLGLPADAIGIGAILLALHGIYVHTDLDWSHGPFALLLASPRYHRWHHADVEAAYGKNLANVFPFYDWLFGTYYVPGPCKVPLGAEGVPHNDVVKLMLWPFLKWPEMIAESVQDLRRGRRREPTIPSLNASDAGQ